MKYRHNENPSNKNFLKVFLISSAVLVVAGAITWLVMLEWYNVNLRPVTDQVSEKVVVISPGESIVKIAQDLQEKGLIRNATAFSWYVTRQKVEKNLQAGTYSLSPSMSVGEIVEIFNKGLVDSSLVTIGPGLRLDEIEALLLEAGFKSEAVNDALYGDYDHPLMRFKPKDASLEGYIFPETFSITATSTPREIISQSFDVFNKLLDSKLVNAIENQKLSVNQAIILASIVQKEASDPDIQKQVAQVFLKRFRQGMPLGSDVTYIYGAAISGREATPDLDSPYNTRIVTGLPPGPIANFNISALRAVAYPADTNYLYFVVGDDEIMRFSNTLEEHQALVNKYCHENCRL